MPDVWMGKKDPHFQSLASINKNYKLRQKIQVKPGLSESFEE